MNDTFPVQAEAYAAFWQFHNPSLSAQSGQMEASDRPTIQSRTSLAPIRTPKSQVRMTSAPNGAGEMRSGLIIAP